jgi:septum formation protein
MARVVNDLILASASPRRLQLLRQIGLDAKVVSADIDETPYLDEKPESYVKRLALEKAKVVQKKLDRGVDDQSIILAADTIIALDDLLLGKPNSEVEAKHMWSLMSGRWHHVLTAVAILDQSQHQVIVQQSRVLFCSLSAEEMDGYWNTGEPVGKAGAYAIQGLAACWVESIEGSYSSIMGLPLFETTKLLKQFGFPVLL